MKISKRQLRRLIIEQADLPSDSYKISSDVKMDDRRGSKKGKVRSKQFSDSTYSDKLQQTNVRTGEKRTMTNLVGDFNKTKKVGYLTTGDKRVQYYVNAMESEGADKDYFYYDMHIGKTAKDKKTDVLLRLSNHPNSKKPGKITYQVGKHPNLKPASPLKAILKLKLMGVKPKELINIMKDLNPDVDVGELESAMKKAVNHKAEDYKEMKEGKIKLSRRQLRQLINEIAQIDPAKFRTNIYGPYYSTTNTPFGLNNPYRIEKEEDITEAMLDDAVQLKDLDMDQAEALLTDAHQISSMLAFELIRVVDTLQGGTGEYANGVPDWVSSYVNYLIFSEAGDQYVAQDFKNAYEEEKAESLGGIIKEFKFTGQDFNIDLSGGDPPPVADSPERGGGGGGKVHQLVRVNFEPGSEFNPAAYTKAPIDMSPGSPFSKMREIYNSFSNQTKNALYQMFPGGVSEEDQDDTWLFRDAYINLLNTMDAAVPMGGDYEYFTIFHPEYASGEDKMKLLDLYRRVTGYTPDENLINEFEIIMHSASAMY